MGLNKIMDKIARGNRATIAEMRELAAELERLRQREPLELEGVLEKATMEPGDVTEEEIGVLVDYIEDLREQAKLANGLLAAQAGDEVTVWWEPDSVAVVGDH